MVARPNVPNVIWVKVSGDVDGLPTVNIFYLQYEAVGTLTSTDMDNVATFINNEWGNQILHHLAPQAAVDEVQTADLAAGPGAAGLSNIRITGSTGSNPPAPAGCCLMINWAITGRYRGGKPRWYISGGPQDQLANPGQWTPTICGLMEGVATTFQGDVNVWSGGNITSLLLGTVHWIKDKAPLAVPTFAPFGANAVGQRIRSQRRRYGART